MRGFVVLALLLGSVASVTARDDAQRVYHLAIGDPSRKDREVPVVLDGIVDTATGQTIAVTDLPERLKDVRLLLAGETHTSLEAHRVQLRVLRALHDAGRRVLVGLEMFPYTHQRHLDDWRAGLLTEDGFLKLSEWYSVWAYNWRYYRDIFLLARDERIPMFAVNTPREVVSAVRKKGLDQLAPEEAAHVPPRVDVDSEDLVALFKASFDEGDMVHVGTSPDAWKGLIAAQATWDASMAWHAVQALRRAGPEAIMVVLVGSGHVAYGVGVERQARQWFDGRIASIVPVPVRDDDGRPIRTVQASYADFVWGVPVERGPHFPTLGISTRAIDSPDGLREVLQVQKHSVAERAGFRVHDVIVSMDGTPAVGRDTLNRLVSAKNWGDGAVFVVRRGETLETLVAQFRRTPEPDSEEVPQP